MKGALIGFVWIIGYWLLIFVLFLKISLSLQTFIAIVLLFGPFGIIAGGIWLGYIHKPKSLLHTKSASSLLTRENNEGSRAVLVDQNGHPINSICALTQQTIIVDQYGNPFLQKKRERTRIGRLLYRSEQYITRKISTSGIIHSPSSTARLSFFNRNDAKRGGCFWLFVPFGALSIFLPPAVILGDWIYQTPIGSFLSNVLLPSLLIAGGLGIVSSFSGWFTGGISRFAFLWIHHIPKKWLGYPGVILTTVGLTLGLMEPTFALSSSSFIFKISTVSVNAVAWSPDDTHIAAGSYDGTVQIWSVITGQHILTYPNHTDSVNAVAWSPDGTRIASGDTDGTVQVWNATTGKRLLTYSNHTDSVNAIAWSPDGTRIASGSDAGTVQIWNAASDQHLLTYSDRTDTAYAVYAVAWSPDGTRIASGSYDGTVQIWGAFTGENMHTYQASSVSAVALSHDGTRIMSGNFDGTVRIWTV